MKSVKAFGFLAVIIAVSAASFGVFLKNSSGKLHEILNLGGSGVEAMGLLFLPIGMIFLYHTFR